MSFSSFHILSLQLSLVQFCGLHFCAHFFLEHSFTLRFLHQIEAPVGQVEKSKNGWEGHSTDDVNFLSSRRKLVEPDLQKVVVFLWLHMNLTMMKFAHHSWASVAWRHGAWMPRGRRRGRRPVSFHHGLLKQIICSTLFQMLQMTIHSCLTIIGLISQMFFLFPTNEAEKAIVA